MMFISSLVKKLWQKGRQIIMYPCG